MSEGENLGTQEKIATAVSVVILLTVVIYWIVQINGVMDMMKLANG